MYYFDRISNLSPRPTAGSNRLLDFVAQCVYKNRYIHTYLDLLRCVKPVYSFRTVVEAYAQHPNLAVG